MVAVFMALIMSIYILMVVAFMTAPLPHVIFVLLAPSQMVVLTCTVAYMAQSLLSMTLVHMWNQTQMIIRLLSCQLKYLLYYG